jgi:spermidine synthase
MANLVGAATGCLLAGFYLLRVYDIFVASFVAVSLNASVALVCLAISSRMSFRASDAPSLRIPSLSAHKVVYLVTALSGLVALGCQVVWTRLLSQVLGGTVFSFTIILAIFITGLGLGSSVGSALARLTRSPYVALGWCQLALVAAVPVAAHMISSELPYWKLNPDFATDLLQRYMHDLVRTAVAILPATCLWGASFPLALAAAAEDGQEPGHLAGGINAANTIGAVVGALLFGTLMIPSVGTSDAQKILTALSAVAVLVMLGARCAPQLATRKRILEPIAAAALIVGFAVLTVQIVPPVSKILIAMGRMAGLEEKIEAYLYVGEGTSASITVADFPSNNTRSLHINGKSVASTGKADMRIERMTGHLPALFHPNPKTALVVGFGAGVTAGSLILHPEIERIVICEIEPLVVEVASEHFAVANYRVLEDPRVEIIYDDARHFIATTREKFDVITSDPIHPWMDGAAALFSVEYYELAKQRLNPGGIVAQWVPLYETDEASVKSEIASFMQSFPEGTLWSSHIPRNEGTDLLMVGQVGPMEIDVNRLAARIEGNPRLEQSMAEVDLGYLITLLATYIGRGPELTAWLEDAQINRERSLRLQYLAGLSIDVYREKEIYRAIATYRRYPEDILIGSPEIAEQVRRRWSQ